MSGEKLNYYRRKFLFSCAATAFLIGTLPFRVFGKGVLGSRLHDISEKNYFPYNIDWDATGVDGFHVGNLVGHKPAGRYGAVTVKDGHFFIPGFGSLRFWGTNVTFDDNFPSHERAKKIAARMSKLGFNLVRFHHMDGFFKNRALCDEHYLKTGKLNPDVMDRLCFFINELKNNGVYHNLNLLTFRKFYHISSLTDYKQLKGNKFSTHFSPDVRAVHKKFIKDVLMWENKYTGFRLGQDPALAMVESNNEDSLMAFLGRGIRNKKVSKYYYNQIKSGFNKYLKEKYKNDINLKGRWRSHEIQSGEKLGKYELPDAREVRKKVLSGEGYGERLKDVIQYLSKLEHDHYSEIKRFLVGELGCVAPLGGVNNWYGHVGTIGSLGSTDYLDMHGYLNKPIEMSRWKSLAWKLKNKITNYYMVLDVNYLAYINETAQDPDVKAEYPQLKNDFFKYPKNYVEGIPCSLSEWNHTGPTQYGYQMPLLVAAYASFQDWDSLAQFHYYGHVEDWSKADFIKRGYDVKNDRLYYKNQSGFDPALMAQTAAASLAFRRGDISVANATILLDLTDEKKWKNTILNDKYDTRMALKHRIRKVYEKGKYAGSMMQEVKVDGEPRNIESDTKEIVWETVPEKKQGRILVNALRTQAATGNLEMGVIEHENVRLDATTSGAVWVTSLSEDSIGKANELLITIAGNSENAGVKYEKLPFSKTKSNMGYYIDKPGGGPVLMSWVRGLLTIKNLDAYKSLKIYPLAKDCRPRSAISVELLKDGFSMQLDAAQTVLYRVEIMRS